MTNIHFSVAEREFSIPVDPQNLSLSFPWFQSMFGEKVFVSQKSSVTKLFGFDVPFEPGGWLGHLVTEVSTHLCRTGFFPFHGALVQFGPKIVVLTGKSGAGKSLWTIALSQFGGRILCDDLFWIRATDKAMQTISIPKPVATRSPIFNGKVFPAEKSVQQSWAWTQVELVSPHADTSNKFSRVKDGGLLALNLLRENSFHLRNFDSKTTYEQIGSRIQLLTKARCWDLAYCDSDTRGFLKFSKEVWESLLATR